MYHRKLEGDALCEPLGLPGRCCKRTRCSSCRGGPRSDSVEQAERDPREELVKDSKKAVATQNRGKTTGGSAKPPTEAVESTAGGGLVGVRWSVLTPKFAGPRLYLHNATLGACAEPGPHERQLERLDTSHPTGSRGFDQGSRSSVFTWLLSTVPSHDDVAHHLCDRSI